MSEDEYNQNVYDRLRTLTREKLEEIYTAWLTFFRMGGRAAFNSERMTDPDTDKTYWDADIAAECAKRAASIDDDEHLIAMIYEAASEMYWYNWRHLKPVLAVVSPYGDEAVLSTKP